MGTPILSDTQRRDLAGRINAEHKAACTAAQTAIEHARGCGELLLEAKAQLPHGAWLPWLAEHCPTLPERTARAYMRVARNWSALEGVAGENGNAVADLPLRRALALLAEPQTADDTPGDRPLVDLDAIRRDERELNDLKAEIRILDRALTAPDLTVDDCGAIVRRSESIVNRVFALNTHGLARLGQLLNDCEARGWTWLADLFRSPELIPPFLEMCAKRIAELQAAEAPR